MTMTEPAEIFVSIVNYCTADMTIDCLRSIEPETRRHPGLRVLVADNASPDGSGAVIADAIVRNGWQAWARLLQQPRNGGFAYGNNAVIREVGLTPSPRKYFWLLNSDTLVRPGATQALLDFLATNPRAGIVGSCLEDPDGTQQHSTFRFHSIIGEFEGSAHVGPISKLLAPWAVAQTCERKAARHDWISGASMMIRSQVVADIGPMNERYFLYFEETDYCLQAAKAGWECWLAPESRIVHLVGASTGVTDRVKRTLRRSPYWFESRRRYFTSHSGRLYAIGADVALATGTVICALAAAIRREPSGTPSHFLRDLFRHSALWGHSETDGRS